MRVQYIDPPVEADEVRVWQNYRQIKCKIADKNGKTLVIAWKWRDGTHVIVWRLDYCHTFRKLHPDDPPEKEVRSGTCWEGYASLDEIVQIVDGWKTDTGLWERMKNWYGDNPDRYPVLDSDWELP